MDEFHYTEDVGAEIADDVNQQLDEYGIQFVEIRASTIVWALQKQMLMEKMTQINSLNPLMQSIKMPCSLNICGYPEFCSTHSDMDFGTYTCSNVTSNTRQEYFSL